MTTFLKYCFAISQSAVMQKLHLGAAWTSHTKHCVCEQFLFRNSDICLLGKSKMEISILWYYLQANTVYSILEDCK